MKILQKIKNKFRKEVKADNYETYVSIQEEQPTKKIIYVLPCSNAQISAGSCICRNCEKVWWCPIENFVREKFLDLFPVIKCSVYTPMGVDNYAKEKRSCFPDSIFPVYGSVFNKPDSIPKEYIEK